MKILFKNDQTEQGFSKLHPILIDLLNAINLWAIQYDKKPIVITDTLSNPELDKKLGRVSPSHSEGRAADIRTVDMSKDKLVALMQNFTEKFLHLGYKTQKGERRLMYYHNNGNGPHIHIAIGYDTIEKYKHLYPNWTYPIHTKPSKKNNKES